MKFLSIFSLFLVALLSYTSAQQCLRSPSCSGPHNVGRRGPGCVARTNWYYDARNRQCRTMIYLGCGGNNNRWCTRAACEQRCRRR